MKKQEFNSLLLFAEVAVKPRYATITNAGKKIFKGTIAQAACRDSS
jgi:hypothetical protein